jgi:ABC-type lipoprotein export system ATPase subunit
MTQLIQAIALVSGLAIMVVTHDPALAALGAFIMACGAVSVVLKDIT